MQKCTPLKIHGFVVNERPEKKAIQMWKTSRHVRMNSEY